MTTTEEWRSVPFEPLLEASSLGRVRSVRYETPMPLRGFKTNRMNPTYGCKVWPSSNHCRYQVTFRRKTYKVAALVCSAFNGPRPVGLVVSHQDEDGNNNAASNLKWDTQKANLNMPLVKAYHRSVCRIKMAAI